MKLPSCAVFWMCVCMSTYGHMREPPAAGFSSAFGSPSGKPLTWFSPGGRKPRFFVCLLGSFK